jgi:hypothetical protein
VKICEGSSANYLGRVDLSEDTREKSEKKIGKSIGGLVDLRCRKSVAGSRVF